MSKNPYLILNISENATQAEITDAYNILVEKYSRERFLEGEAGEVAARKLGEINEAYGEAINIAKKATFISDGHDEFFEIERAIKEKQLDEAQAKLDDIITRSAKWNYLQANIYYCRGWLIECKNQMEIALKLEPENKKYQIDYDRLVSEMNPSQVFSADKTARTHPQGRSYTGERSDSDICCDSCSTCLCVNCLCNCCGS
ncbi:MAG: hypothetical protein RR357_00325 [Clostridia bacterium]